MNGKNEFKSLCFYIVKMFGTEEEIFAYLYNVGEDLMEEEECAEITEEVMNQLPEHIQSEEEWVNILCNILTSLSHRKCHYDTLAVRLMEKLHESKTPFLYSEVVKKIQHNKDLLGDYKPLLSSEFVQFVERNKKKVDELFQEVIKDSEPFQFTTFGWKTLQRHYLLRTSDGIIERPDHLWYRISLFLHRSRWDRVEASFRALRQGQFIQATPTLFHAGLKHPQMASCFLVGTEDSVAGIFKTLADAAQISKWAGGLGIHISNIRSKNSYIHGTNGFSNGIMPMLKVYNDTSRYIDQCFSGETRVVTERGMIPIQEVSPLTDRVLTSSGVFHRVLRKNQFRKKTDLVRMELSTMDLEKVTVTVTLQHEFMTAPQHYEALENIGFGKKFYFVSPPSHEDGSWQEEELYNIGYIYRHSVQRNDGFDIPMSTTHELFASMGHFLKRCYGTYYEYREGVFQVRPQEILLPEKVDHSFLGKQDFPLYFLQLPPRKLRAFVHGFLPLNRNNPKEAFLYYAMHADKIQDRHQITRLEVVDTPTIVYDLVVDQDPSYQTEVGLVHNGGGKRNGAFAMYIEPWHADIFDFVSAKRNIGSEEDRARDLFYALWVPDLFMKQVGLENGDWYLFSPSQAPELSTLHGERFEEAYWQHVRNGNYHKKIKARQLWIEILRSQIETGTPYMLYKDTCNRRSNQQNLGTIRSSNLCCEIIEYSDNKEYAVCNLGSLALPKFLGPPVQQWNHLDIFTKPGCPYCVLLKHFLHKHKFVYEEHFEIPKEYQSFHKTYPMVLVDGAYVGGFEDMWKKYLCPFFDFAQFEEAIHTLVVNLNRVIDLNAYPLPECKRSNMRHRPIGIGVQGLADVFFHMRMPYDSVEARRLNRQIFEALYYFALRSSLQLAKEEGHYETFIGSPLSKGRFHFDLCGGVDLDGTHDWESLRKEIQEHGTRNSLLVAPMPTASTSQILGNTESFEPLTNNLYVRRTLAGEFYVCNPFLREDLEALGEWSNDTIEHLIVRKGSVQDLPIPSDLKQIYRTVWEIPQKSLIDMAADRQMFIDQSQSFNVYLNEPTMDKLTKIHFYGWKKGLKTGSYYVRSRAAISSQNVTIDPMKEKSCESCSA